jgi:hypothetical protein
MSAAHTPGPWEIDYDTRPAEVCTVHGLPQDGEDQLGYAYVRGAIGYWDADAAENLANLRLIAAAPDLLAAARQALTECVDLMATPAGEALEAAIAKATGSAA